MRVVTCTPPGGHQSPQHIQTTEFHSTTLHLTQGDHTTFGGDAGRAVSARLGFPSPSSDSCINCGDVSNLNVCSCELIVQPPRIIILEGSETSRTETIADETGKLVEVERHTLQLWDYPDLICIPLSHFRFRRVGIIYFSDARQHYTSVATPFGQSWGLRHDGLDVSGLICVQDASEPLPIDWNHPVAASAVYVMEGGRYAQETIAAYRTRYLSEYMGLKVETTRNAEG